MTSSTSTGDRRWASTRRGGMTVLGKVAVPKPINLPSQRLENHGLDPNVEIVPKGTVGWGSRSSSSTPNAWGSSTLPSNTDGGANSPGRLSARPSSGETGTRPSTAGSDRIHDSTPNAWSSNSRPSSASGALSSSQTSLASLRPRSAETRPGSSQLSRFAELPSEISAVGSDERLGLSSSQNDGFSLTTRDFPTLGSVKSSSGKNIVSQEYESHESGSSGGNAPTKESTRNYGDASLNMDGKSNSDNAWRRDSPPYSEDGHRHGAEKWNGDPQQYQNSGILPQHFSAWHGPPVNNPPGGVWFRGPPGGPPPYGGPIPPGGFPMEPFPYFRPQIPASTHPNPQPVAPSGSGPRGHRPNNGELYRPQMPDAFMRPAMPMRPGFYPGPVPYDGYFRPPIGYCNPNEREIPFMSMGGGPPAIYGQFVGQTAPDSSNPRKKSPGYGSNHNVSNPEELESGHSRDGREQYKVLLKQQDGWDEQGEERKLERMGATESPVSRETEKVPDNIELGNEASSHKFESGAGGSNLPIKVKSPDNVETARVSRAPERRPDHSLVVSPHASKDSTLIQKIEGLNAKARASDARPEVLFVSDRLGQGNKMRIADVKFSHSTPEAVIPSHIDSVQASTGVPTEEKRLEEATVGVANTSRRYPLQGKGSHRAKGRINTEDVDGWRKKSTALDPILPSPAQGSDSIVQIHPASPKSTITSASPYPQKDEGSAHFSSGPVNNQVQRANLREQMKQRAKQRQEEEEERIRDQKAKARMKLEELDRRTQVMEVSNTKLESGIENKQQNLPSHFETTISSSKSTTSSSTPVPNSYLLPQIGASRTDAVQKSSVLSKERPQEAPQRIPLRNDAKVADANSLNNSPKVPDSNSSKQILLSDKKKQNSLVERNYILKSVDAQRCQADAANNVSTSVEIVSKESISCEANLLVNSRSAVDSAAHQKRKFSKSGRSKIKVDESKENLGSSSVDSGKLKDSESEMSRISVQAPASSNDGSEHSEQRPELTNEEAPAKVNNQWKSQPSRRGARNQHSNRASEKFQGVDAAVWAPVRSQSKTEVSDESSEKIVGEGMSSSTKGDNVVQSNLKNKRTEMERYVPKPVAKEMAQLGGIHQHTTQDSSQVKTDEAVQRADSSSCSGLGKDFRNLDGRQGKSGRVNASWRQRGSIDSTTFQCLSVEQSHSDALGSCGSDKKLSEHHHHRQNPAEGSAREQPKYNDEWQSDDVAGDLCNSASQATLPVVRDQGIPGRGRRHLLKAQKGTGSGADLDAKKSGRDLDAKKSGWESERSSNPSSLAPEVGQIDSSVALKENHNIGERSTLHWQPKGRASSGHNYRGSRAVGFRGSGGAESGGVNVEDSSHHGGVASMPPQPEETHDHVVHGEDRTNESEQVDSKKERKSRPFTGPGRPQSPNQGLAQLQESGAPAEDHHEVGFSSGSRRNGNQNSRPGRGNNNHGDWNSSRQDSRHQSAPGHRERQQYNPHYKYQPVGMQNDGRSNQFEGSRDGAHNAGSRYKERINHGPGNSRRGGGNF